MTSKRALETAVGLHQQGKYAEALAQYEKLQESDPDNAHLFHFRALIQIQMGDLPAAVSLLVNAIQRNPANPVFYQTLAETFVTLNEPSKAAQVYGDMGNVLQRHGKYQEAVAAYDKSLELVADIQAIQSNRLFALQHLAGQGKDLRQTSLLVIDDLVGRAETAADFLRLGIAYQAVLDHEKALSAVNRAIELDPDYAPAHQNKASLLLIEGQWAEGWHEDEWRWHPKSTLVDKVRSGFAAPAWVGKTPDELSGPLLVVSEQGYGDTLQFARYVKLLAQQGFDILFEVQQPLLKLMHHSLRHPRIRVIPRLVYRWDKWNLGWLGKRLGQKPRIAGSLDLYHGLKFSAWVGVMSLPSRFGTTPDAIPAATPYLSVSPKAVKRLNRLMTSDDGKPKVGLVWAGNPEHPEDFNRSLTLAQLEPILSQSHVRFYSLQKGSPAAQIASHKAIIDLSPYLNDFNDTAAAIENLDLVITVDTSVAHLAGGLNKPVWIVIPRVKDWRWGKTGSTTGWYPSARLFRQHEQGNWDVALKELASALETMEFR